MAQKQNAAGRAEVERRFKENQNFDRDQAAKDLGVHERTVRKWVAAFRRSKAPKRINRKLKPIGGLEAFRNQYDDSIIVPKQIEEGIVKCLVEPDGTPSWMRDRDFREACGVGPGKWRRYADDYKHLQVTVRGEIIWGHPEIIDEMRMAAQR